MSESCYKGESRSRGERVRPANATHISIATHSVWGTFLIPIAMLMTPILPQVRPADGVGGDKFTRSVSLNRL